MTDIEGFGWITESVTLRLKRTKRSVHTYPDLTSAEADVWTRYRSQRRARNPERQNP